MSATTNATHRELLTGWGRTCPSAALVIPAMEPGQIRRTMTKGPTIARGMGRSYGDAAQNGGGVVLDATALPRTIELDAEHGTVTVDGGTTIAEVLRAVVPLGWFLPVTPGTAQVTIGGAIAADVHGKNHHLDGTLGSHLAALTLQTPSGIHHLRPDDATAPSFWATTGGMGLTGVITKATIKLRPIETALMASDTERTRDLDDTMNRLTDTDRDHPYSVAWLDALAPGSAFGRGVITSGDHLRRNEPHDTNRAVYDPRSRSLPIPVMSAPTATAARAFNAAWYRLARPGHHVESITSFFHPLDAVANWNRIYGRRGFLQWQFVVPDGSEALIAETLTQLAACRAGKPYLVVLKRFGPANPAPLSFPMPGWTLAVDLPATNDELRATLNRLDDKIVAARGRLYLAKDSRMRPELIGDMYPRLDEWRTLRNQLDPEHLMRSDLAQRLNLVEDRPRTHP